MLTDLKTDPKVVEQLVEIITHEVLVAMLEQKEMEKAPEGGQCKFNCTDGLCVRTCFDRAGHVVSAGADRLSSTLGVIPGDIEPGQNHRPYPAQTGCHPGPDRPVVLRSPQVRVLPPCVSTPPGWNFAPNYSKGPR